jgi:hypothetical protein
VWDAAFDSNMVETMVGCSSWLRQGRFWPCQSSPSLPGRREGALVSLEAPIERSLV